MKSDLEDPLLSVIVLSTLIVYGNSVPGGRAGSSARSARVPCPISRLLGAPIRPVSPTQEGGNVYYKTKKINHSVQRKNEDAILQKFVGRAGLYPILVLGGVGCNQ